MNHFKAVLSCILSAMVCAFSCQVWADDSPHGMKVLDEQFKTTSKPLFDPGLDRNNADQFHTDDGSSLSGIEPVPLHAETMTYEKSVQNPKIKELNERAKEFFEKEKDKRQAFRSDVRSTHMNPDERQKKLRDYRQKELERRQEFAKKQQAAIDKIFCDQPENKDSTSCKNKQSLFRFFGF